MLGLRKYSVVAELLREANVSLSRSYFTPPTSVLEAKKQYL